MTAETYKLQLLDLDQTAHGLLDIVIFIRFLGYITVSNCYSHSTSRCWQRCCIVILQPLLTASWATNRAKGLVTCWRRSSSNSSTRGLRWELLLKSSHGYSAAYEIMKYFFCAYFWCLRCQKPFRAEKRVGLCGDKKPFRCQETVEWEQHILFVISCCSGIFKKQIKKFGIGWVI